jgi:hypothetical protein
MRSDAEKLSFLCLPSCLQAAILNLPFPASPTPTSLPAPPASHLHHVCHQPQYQHPLVAHEPDEQAEDGDLDEQGACRHDHQQLGLVPGGEAQGELEVLDEGVLRRRIGQGG